MRGDDRAPKIALDTETRRSSGIGPQMTQMTQIMTPYLRHLCALRHLDAEIRVAINQLSSRMS